MTTEERMKTLFVEANPIPDADMIDLDQVGGAAYLAMLEQRSSTVTRTEVEARDGTRSGRRTATWLVAAMAVVVLGVVGFLTWPRDEGPVAADTSEEIVQLFISTRDYATFESLVTDNWMTTSLEESGFSTGGEMMQTVWANEETIGVDRALVSCDPLGEDAAQCHMSYTDDIMKALSEAPLVEPTTFNFVDGKVDSGAPIGHDPRSDFSRYASAAGLQQQFLDACGEAPVRTGCMRFIMDNLEGWAAWVGANQ